MKFKFDKIFDKDAQQEKIFDLVAKEVVEAAVEGYNGTIFAYGQTGSGKTFTITGPDTEDGQGIIPRTLKHLFYLSQVKEMRIKINIQYLQIYNGAGYDLLDEKAFDPKNEAKDRVQMLQDLNKVRTM
jgi:kinesin family protein 6/9